MFPWVIADYTSPVLDLHNPATYRDLSKPIGALNPTRLREILDRYRTFDADVMPPFMYGSHYSSAGVVIHYMVRQVPKTPIKPLSRPLSRPLSKHYSSAGVVIHYMVRQVPSASI